MSDAAWRLMDDYPCCSCDGGWGPTVALRFEGSEAIFAGWKEAGMWLCHDPEEPNACMMFAREPQSWMDLGEVWTCPTDGTAYAAVPEPSP